MSSNNLAAWLSDYIQKHPGGTRLPTDKALAGHFNISVRTVIRTMQRFIAGGGRLERVRGSGTFAGPVVTQPPPPPAQSAAQLVADGVYQSICKGDFKTGDALPAIKFMSLRFKVSYATVVKAYRLLRETGMVTQVGKTFWVGTFKDSVFPPRKKTVYFFNYGNSDFSNTYDDIVMGSAYQRMEKQLHDSGYLVRYENTDDLDRLIAGWQKSRDYPEGLVLCRLDEDQYEQLLPALKRCRRQLGEWAPPVLIDWCRGRYRKELPGIQVFAQGNILTTAVRSLAEYIIRKKYRTTIIFMDVGRMVWSLEGTGLTLYRLYWELWAKDHEYLPRYAVIPAAYEKDYLGRLRDIEIIEKIREQTVSFSTRPPEKLLASVARDTAIAEDFERSLNDFRNAELWIFTHSDLAARAHAWALKQGLKIPRHVSIITLENDPRYFHLGLTYCGPDWDTIGYQMAHAIIRDFPVATTSKGFIKTRAAVIEKLTTR